MTMPSLPPAPARSDFVTVLAWIFIVLAGFAIAMLALQTIVISALPFGETQKYAQQSPNDSYAMQEMVFGGLRVMLLVLLALSALTLVAAIGLLRRWNWARLLFIVFMAFGVLMHIGGLALSPFMFASIPHMEGAGSPEIPQYFGKMMIMMLGFSAAISIGFVVLFGWIIKRLTAPDIRREFGAL